jgi:hypothetical protein
LAARSWCVHPLADWSYRCIGKLLATSIVVAATQPTIATRSLVARP